MFVLAEWLWRQPFCQHEHRTLEWSPATHPFLPSMDIGGKCACGCGCQYFRTLPHEVMDAAKVDGAGHLRTLWSIVLPLARPAIVTMALLSIVAKWNDFLWPLLVTNTREMRVLL